MREVADRSDIFSFGVVLYEMLTGRQPFQGETAPDVLASVLARDPDITTLPANLHPRLLDLVKRCLEKNPKCRWQAIGDVRAEIELVAADPRGVSAIAHGAAPPRPLWKRALPVAIGAIVASALTGLAIWNMRPRLLPGTVTRFSFAFPEGQRFTNMGRQVVAISPDGTQMVFGVNQRLFVRAMSDLEGRFLEPKGSARFSIRSSRQTVDPLRLSRDRQPPQPR